MGVVEEIRTDLRELSRVFDQVSAPGSIAGPPQSGRALRRLAASHDGFKVVVLTRIREAARRRRIPVVNHVLRLATSAVFGIEVGNDVRLGRGVDIVHSLGTVVGGTSQVGDRVRLLGNNTIGTARGNGCPVIGNDVVIACGARVLGPVTVGDGAFIGANAVVLKDVAPAATVVGVPAVPVESSAEADGLTGG